MDRTIGVGVCVLLLATAGAALSVTKQQTILMQVVSTQDSQGNSDSDILFYISDDDQRNQVAVDFPDTVDYAEASIPQPPDVPELPPSPFMTGDIFDNDLSDETKLVINSALPTDVPLVIWDSDDAQEIPEEPPDTDEDPNAVSSPLIDLSGDLDDERWNPLTQLRVAAQQRTSTPLTWGAEDIDDWLVAEADGTVVLGEPETVEAFTARTPSSEFVYDLDEEAVQVAGVRYVQSDVNGVPLFYGGDPTQTMAGDTFDNGRSDATPLRTTVQEADNPLQWVRVTRRPRLNLENLTTDDIDEVIITEADEEPEVDIVEEQEDVDELEEIDTVFEPVDIEVRDEDDGGDLELLTSPRNADYMVGDLFDNTRTDESKLTIIGQEAGNRLQWQTDIDELLDQQVFPEPELPALEIEEETSVDVDDADNIYVTPESTYTDVEEEIIPEAALAVEDSDEAEERVERQGLGFNSPLGYMNGDLFDNSRSDTSMLRVQQLRGSGVAWTDIDVDDLKTVYDLEPPANAVDLDELLTTYDVDYQLFQDVDDLPTTTPSQEEEILATGDRLTFYDEDDVPTFFSDDQEDYLAGDLYDNSRSDASRLTIVQQEGRNTEWNDVDDFSDRRNPGFLQ